MKSKTFISWLFVVAAIYDGLLGLIFLFVPRIIFQWFDVTEPNHFGYVQFPAALLIIFSIMFIKIAWEPVANRNLIIYGILLKISYCGVTFKHWFCEGIPHIWKPFTIFDLIFLMFFIISYFLLRKKQLQNN
jgi:hypothetical protein